VPVLAGQGSPVRCLVIHTIMVTITGHPCGPGGAMDLPVVSVVDLVVVSVAVGEDGDLMDTMYGKY
jgi:hypothetical protein